MATYGYQCEFLELESHGLNRWDKTQFSGLFEYISLKGVIKLVFP